MYKVNKVNCTGCQVCVQTCPGATKIGTDGKAEVVDQKKLEACGGEKVCPFGAIEKIDGTKESETNNADKSDVSPADPSLGGRGIGAGRGRGMGRGPRDGRGRGMGMGRGRRH